MKEIKINTDFIKLDSLMKWAAIVSQGSDAKMLIKEGYVKVNGEVELRRGKKIYKDDIVEFEGIEYKVI